MTNYSAVPYVLISGSYQQNRTNDKLCNYLGNKLAQHNFNIISGGSKPAIKISEGMNRMLTDLNQYENSRIVTVYRRKGSEDELKIKRIGNIRFEGNDIQEMREYLFINSKAMVVIGGSMKTKEEILLAQEKNLPVVPVAMTGGTALNAWLHYQKNARYKDEDLFIRLNNKNFVVASDAVIEILQDLILRVQDESSIMNSNHQYY